MVNWAETIIYMIYTVIDNFIHEDECKNWFCFMRIIHLISIINLLYMGRNLIANTSKD